MLPLPNSLNLLKLWNMQSLPNSMHFGMLQNIQLLPNSLHFRLMLRNNHYSQIHCTIDLWYGIWKLFQIRCTTFGYELDRIRDINEKYTPAFQWVVIPVHCHTNLLHTWPPYAVHGSLIHYALSTLICNVDFAFKISPMFNRYTILNKKTSLFLFCIIIHYELCIFQNSPSVTI